MQHACPHCNELARWIAGNSRVAGDPRAIASRSAEHGDAGFAAFFALPALAFADACCVAYANVLTRGSRAPRRGSELSHLRGMLASTMDVRSARAARIADIIRSRHDQIIALWLKDATSAASARGVNQVALTNVMPEYVSALADLLDTGRSDASERLRNRLDSHVSTRIRQGFDLAEMVNELALLGSSISSVWRALPEREWPSAADIDSLLLQLHGAMADVTETFRRHMLEDEQTEKRYSRLLQSIATESLHEPGPPLRERLREVVALVMQAMDAQCAAFALYDVARGELVLVASAGVASIEPYVASLASTSFVGEIAAHAEPTTVYDATATPLEIPDALRRSGVHSLLGVRLPTRNRLLGVMYVGTSGRREFSPREQARIESLGEQLVLHLENARLVAELHATIDELRTERGLREHFVSVLAHDLRGPLSAAALSATLLARRQSGAADRPDLPIKIQRNIARADRMISDLLDANRIRARQPLLLRLADCDLTAVVQRVAEEARELHGDRFVVDCEQPHVLGIWSDDELHRALWNLVTNAVKYGAADQPITIRVERGHGTARVSVHNEGTPIPRVDQATLFDAYTRAPAARSSGSPGWGLGLTVVRGAAEAHGGQVTLRSDATGTTFTVELPDDARPYQPDASDRAPAVASTTVY